MKRATNYICKLSVFRLDTGRERDRRRRHPLTSSPLPTHVESGEGLGAQTHHPSSSSQPLGGGEDPRGAQVHDPRVPPLAHWLGRSWLVNVYNNGWHIASIPIACPANESPRFSCPCGVPVYVTLHLNDMNDHPQVHLVWLYGIGEDQPSSFTSAYDAQMSLASCPSCTSQFHLAGPS